jgi:hypothetical protein
MVHGNQTGTPVNTNIISFKGKTQNNTNELTWGVISEPNIANYTIERASTDLQWESIEEVRGAGNTTDFRWYRYLDVAPQPEFNYYRIKQSGDIDSYSPVIKIAQITQCVVFIFPNPMHNYLHININQAAYLTVTNTAEKVVIDMHLDGSQTIYTEQLPKGAYQIHVYDLDMKLVYSEKIVKR